MFKITNGHLESTSLERLASFQTPIDQESRYADKVEKAQTQWDAKRQDWVFGTVTDKLIKMCQAGDYCHYCCRSEAGHIDHLQPKSLYPGLTFAWSNFIYACERCNTKHKRDHCAVVISGIQPQLIDITRPHLRTDAGRASVRPPRKGQLAIINPRREDPMDFLRLDLLGTFHFDPKHAPDTAEWLRADYTIRLLGLNTRPGLIRERRGAYKAIMKFLKGYHDASINGHIAEKSRMRKNIREISHQAVWQELARSHQRIAEVAHVFADCPELVRRQL